VRETKQGQFFKHPCENIKTGKPRAHAAYYWKVSSSEAKIKRTKLMKCSQIHNDMKELTYSDKCFEADFITCLGMISTW